MSENLLTGEEREALQKALLAEQKLVELAKENRAPLGFGWYDLQCPPWVLYRLSQKGFLKVVSVWRRGLLYRVANPELVKQVLNGEVNFSQPSKVEIPDDLFSCIEGYDDLKQLLLADIKGDARVHILLWGSPATAKTLFLLELSRLQGSCYIVGSRVSKAGLSRLLLEQQPKFLLIDEIDRISGKDLGVLLSLMETGVVKETIVGGKETVLNTVVFGACNRVDTLPEELRSRFLEFYFPPYSREEFLRVATNFLIKREGMDESTAKRVAEFCLRWRDVRKARAVARLFRVMGDRIFEILENQKR
jgi:Holliday junction DNA helicase RuvB